MGILFGVASAWVHQARKQKEARLYAEKQLLLYVGYENEIQIDEDGLRTFESSSNAASSLSFLPISWRELLGKDAEWNVIAVGGLCRDYHEMYLTSKEDPEAIHFGMNCKEVVRLSEKLPMAGSFTFDLNIPFIHGSLGQSEKDFSVLKSLSKLKSLNLDYAFSEEFDTSNLEVLSNLSQLEELSLANTNLTNVSFFQELTQLKRFSLRSTAVVDVSPFKHLSELETLILDRTNIANIQAVRNLQKLKYLSLLDTPVANIDSIKGLKNLTYLNLGETKITDFSALSELKRLKVLNLSSTKITDLSVLKGLTHLEKLYLANTQIEDVTPLTSLANLKILDIRNTPVDKKISHEIIYFHKNSELSIFSNYHE